jgi:hypothetical protein
MYSSPRHHVRGSPYRANQIPEGPIQDFATIIENTQPEDWQRRTSAFMALVNTIPSGSEYSNGQAWYNSPPILRHMAIPLSALLSDARSTVVKRTCEFCTDLFAKCQSDARYLLKDIMPTILAVHAQTVQVIRTYVQNMIIETMRVCPCKMCMPMWLDRLKSDKSRTVREACCLYLGVGLSEWTEPGYLTKEIWIQVGAALIKALKDSAPQVRNHGRRSLETVFQLQPGVFEKLAQDMDLTRDMRVKKVLRRIQNGETVADDVSVASSRVGSVASRSVRSGFVGGMGRKTQSPSYLRTTGTPRGAGGPTTNSRSMGIPKTIGVATSPAYGASSAPPPRGLGPPVRVAAPFKTAVESPPKISRKTSDARPAPIITTTNGTPTSLITADKALGNSFDTQDTADSELPVIANTKELREVAKARNSRRSSLLMERIQRSISASNSNADAPGLVLGESHDSLLDDILDSNGHVDDEDLPEHSKIAHAILETHKAHVDQIMETLKVEMDALKEFELVLLEEGPRRPTEDEVLEYFESVGLCLEQRSKAGSNLQKKMDRISKGADS